MTALRDDTQRIEQRIGRLRSRDELARAFRDGRIPGITPRGNWMIAHFHPRSESIAALEFMQSSDAAKRWPTLGVIDREKALLEVHPSFPDVLKYHPAS